MIRPEDLVGGEWAEWYRLTPRQRARRPAGRGHCRPSIHRGVSAAWACSPLPVSPPVGGRHARRSDGEDARFWLQELRTPEILVALAADHGRLCQGLASERPLLAIAIRGRDLPALELALLTEEATERASDRRYWLPLRAKLERLRRRRLRAAHRRHARPQSITTPGVDMTPSRMMSLRSSTFPARERGSRTRFPAQRSDRRHSDRSTGCASPSSPTRPP